MKCILLASAIVLTGAWTVPPQSQRTAMWYVGHPSALKVVLVACRNDPGHADGNSDCKNATQAEIILNADRASASIDMTPPSDSRYWRIHPEQLGPKLFTCGNVTALETWRAIFCDSAVAAERGQ